MKDVIEEIARVRARNNGLWMSILEIALEAAPEDTKEVLREINDNDRAISAMLRELTQ